MSRTVLAAFAAVIFLAGQVTTVWAQTGPAGPVVFKNESSVKLTLTNFSYVDNLGQTRTLPTGKWELEPGFYGYLTQGIGQNKIVAKKIMYDLITVDGKSEGWYAECKRLDDDGDFSSGFTSDNYATHLKDLGKSPVVAFKPVVAGPTDEQIARAVLKALGALVLHQAASEEPEGLLQIIAIEAARKGRDELIKSSIDDLFPQVALRDRATLGRLVPLALDGRLTDENLRAAEAKDAIVNYLRKQNPDFALTAEAADFLYRVQQGAR